MQQDAGGTDFDGPVKNRITTESVIPAKALHRMVYRAKAGIQFLIVFNFLNSWMPAFAGMTNYGSVSGGGREGWE